MMMMILLPRLRRLSMGMVAHYCYHGSYRFSYISRGTPGGATHSVLLLHGFSANKDSWLPIVKVPAPLQWWWTCERHEQLCHSAQSWNVLLSSFHTSRASLSSPCSISPKTGMSCVWICQDTQERVAQEQRTTATRARSTDSTRSVAHGTQNRLYVLPGWRSCSLEEVLLFQFFLAFQFLQFVQSVGLDKRPFHLVGTSMGGHVAGVYAAQYPANVCSLTLICPSGKLSTCFQVWLFYLQKPLRPCNNCYRFSRSHLSHRDKVHGGFEGESGEATDRLNCPDPLHAPGTQEPSEVGLLQACHAPQASELHSRCNVLEKWVSSHQISFHFQFFHRMKFYLLIVHLLSLKWKK